MHGQQNIKNSRLLFPGKILCSFAEVSWR